MEEKVILAIFIGAPILALVILCILILRWKRNARRIIQRQMHAHDEQREELIKRVYFHEDHP